MTSAPPLPLAAKSHALAAPLAPPAAHALAAHSLAAHAPAAHTATWDNACTINLTNDTSLTYNCHKLPTPIAISGIGGKDKATHVCQLKALPSSPRGMNTVLFSPTFSHNLFSLGQLQQHGGTYATS